MFDDIVQNEYIIARAEDIACYYDDLIEYTQYYNLLGEGTHNVGGKLVTVSLRELKKKLYLCLMCVNVLEAIRFYVSFACSFAFAERELMEGNAKIIKLIARDEALHLTSTQHMLNLCAPVQTTLKWRNRRRIAGRMFQTLQKSGGAGKRMGGLSV